jgi:MinD superfamily P-loop ATPase
MKKITIVSGKGGVGKTSLTASLAYLYAHDNFKIVLADCDADAPNLALTFKHEVIEKRDISSGMIAVVNSEACVSCKKCFENCKFEAIKWDGNLDIPVFDEFSCEGCGVCRLVCPASCIQLNPIKTGELIITKTSQGFPIVSGDLRIGRGNSGKIVAEAKMAALKIAEQNRSDIILSDGPPGIGCPVIASLSDSDFVIIITEPMPAAIHDLKRVLSLTWHFTNEIGIVVNKFDMNIPLFNELTAFSEENGLHFLGRIPFDETVPNAIVNITPQVEFAPDSPASRAILEVYKKLNTYLGLKKLSV